SPFSDLTLTTSPSWPPPKKNNGKATAAAIPEARLTEAERLAAVDALLEKKKATAVKAATTRARNKKAKEAAAQALWGQTRSPFRALRTTLRALPATFLSLVRVTVAALHRALDAQILWWTCAVVSLQPHRVVTARTPPRRS
ncbi:hypothetical protein GMDG_08630, partial [Pseudogymnoascus destructans 20631-21]